MIGFIATNLKLRMFIQDKLFWQAISRDYHAIITPSYNHVKDTKEHNKFMKDVHSKLINLYEDLKKQGNFVEDKWIPLGDIIKYEPWVVTNYSN